MFVSILVSVLFVVCPSSVIAITLPSGFVFDETPYLAVEARANNAVETCERTIDGCSNDCSTKLQCNENAVVSSNYPCNPSMPFCVKNTGYATCSGNFPMSNEACLARAINNFVCTADGDFPDPTDCTKYHVCSGNSQSIIECPANSIFSADPNFMDWYTNPGNGTFSCQFSLDGGLCDCEKFFCDGYANSYTFRAMDYFHYAYCLEIGTMMKTVMFKCPMGTRHYGVVSTMTNLVDCVPVEAPVV